MEDKPTLDELLTHVDVGTEWLRLGVLLELDMKDLTAIEHERPTIDQRLQYMYTLWLKTSPNATRRQLIKALGIIRANTLADKYKKWISSTGRGEQCSAQQHISDREGSGSPQCKHIKKELGNVLTENQVKIHGIFTETDETLKEIAKELNAVNIISKVVQKNPTYDAMIGSFLSGIDLKEDIEEIEEHSKKFFQSLSNVGGPVADVSDFIKKKWKKAVKDKFALELKI